MTDPEPIEIEISLEEDDATIQFKEVEKSEKKIPSYFECSGEYTVFDYSEIPSEPDLESSNNSSSS